MNRVHKKAKEVKANAMDNVNSHIDVNSAPVPPPGLQLDLFWRWLWKHYQYEMVKEFCNKTYVDKITDSVWTNPARRKESGDQKQSTIGRVYYTVCFSSRGPYYREHREAKDRLRALHKTYVNTRY
jgi:hypothetical protein